MTYLDHFCAGVAVGSFAYTSDSVSLFASATNETTKREFDSDWKGRRTRRAEYQRNGAAWDLLETRTFVYDDWNLIYEQIERPGESAAELAYFWGPDLSGTLQGAGGVGGLVAVSIAGQFYFPGYDNNGNVIGYWDESGSLVAEYAYDAFGNTISSSGSMASVFPHCFSTKYYDAETDLYYYGYRYYSPSLGRWISRDPICERGGANLYSSFGNDAVWRIDLFGLLVQVIEAAEPVPMTDAERKNAPDVVIPDGIKKVEEFLREFYTISLQDFDRSVRNGCVKFNGETFTGSRTQYWFKVLTEKFSSYSLNTSSDLDAFANIVKQKARLVTQPHDRLVVTAHGLDESDTEGNPVDEAKVGEKWYERAVLYPKLETAAGTARDKLIIISCYSTWNPKEQLAKETVESLNIISPICKPIRESAKSRPSARSFVIEFTPFQAFRFIGRKIADENY